MDFEQAKSIVLEHKPVFGFILKNFGSLSLWDYFKKNLASVAPVASSRYQELLSVISSMVQKLLGAEVAQQVVDDLVKKYYVSTADHHGPLVHPFFLNSNIVQTLVNSEAGLSSTLVLACSSISFNNSSFPRGFIWHNQLLREERCHFVPWKYRQYSLYKFAGCSRGSIAKALGEIKKSSLAKVYQARLYEFIDTEILNEQVLTQPTYWGQMTVVNHSLWQKLGLNNKPHSLIYLSQEDIAVELLLKYHFNQPTVLNKLLFDAEAITLFEKYFNGLTGAFTSSGHKGTILWWGLKNGQRLQLVRQGKFLVAMDNSYSLEIAPEPIIKALEQGELMPSLALTFIVIAGFYGLRCGGGFSQVNYLTDIKLAYQKLLLELGDSEAASDVGRVDTSFFAGEFILALLQARNKKIPATSFDLLLYGGQDLSSQLKFLANTVTLSSAVDYMMPELYKIITGQSLLVPASEFKHLACAYV